LNQPVNSGNPRGEELIFKLHFLPKYNTLPGSEKKAEMEGKDLELTLK
jgi:hypothetical protein